MLVKVDVREIVRDHLETLTDFNSKRRSRSDLFLFFGIPLLIAGAMIAGDYLLASGSANILITALAIFAGLLFNLLLLAHGMLRSADPPRFPEEKALIREIYSNISYAIFVSLVAITILLGAIFPGPKWAAQLGSLFSYFLVLNFLLTLLMVLRRVHILLAKEFRRG